MFTDLLIAACSLFFMMLMGFYLRKRHIVDERFGRQLAGLVTNVVLPCAIIQYMAIDASKEELQAGSRMIVFGCAISAILFFIGYTVYRISGRSDIGKVMWAGTLGTNVSLYGYPVVESIFGSEGLFLYTMMLIPVRVVSYIMVERVLQSGDLAQKRKLSLKDFYSPLLVYLAIGLIICFGHLKVPALFASTIKSVSGALTPMGMMLCGFTLADADFRSLLKDKQVYFFCVVKFIICPVVAFVLTKVMGANYMQALLVILFTCFPVGSVVNTYAIKNNCAPVQASAYTAFTTLISLCIVPVAVFLSTLIM